MDIGLLTIRQDICVLKDPDEDRFVSFQDIAMSLWGKNLTYVEIKNEL